jgi:hypothetical protein
MFDDCKHIFIGPDRTAQERVARRNLVNTLKMKIKENPEHNQFIQSEKIFSTETLVLYIYSNRPSEKDRSPHFPGVNLSSLEESKTL